MHMSDQATTAGTGARETQAAGPFDEALAPDHERWLWPWGVAAAVAVYFGVFLAIAAGYWIYAGTFEASLLADYHAQAWAAFIAAEVVLALAILRLSPRAGSVTLTPGMEARRLRWLPGTAGAAGIAAYLALNFAGGWDDPVTRQIAPVVVVTTILVAWAAARIVNFAWSAAAAMAASMRLGVVIEAEELLRVRGATRSGLVFLSGMVVLTTLATAAIMQTGGGDVDNPFYKPVLLTYGLFFTALLGVATVPPQVVLFDLGRELAKRVHSLDQVRWVGKALSAEQAAAAAERVARRKELEEFLGLTASDGVQAALAVLAPVLAAIVTIAVGK
jgi:hypothetical protein